MVARPLETAVRCPPDRVFSIQQKPAPFGVRIGFQEAGSPLGRPAVSKCPALEDRGFSGKLRKSLVSPRRAKPPFKMNKGTLQKRAVMEAQIG